MGFRAPVRAEELKPLEGNVPQFSTGTGMFDKLRSLLQGTPEPIDVQQQLDSFFSSAPTPLLGGPAVIGSTAARSAAPLIKWLTERIVGGGSMLQGPVSKITQVPVRDIVVRGADHPDAINPLKVNEIRSLLSSSPSRVPAVELAEEGGKLVLKDGRHRFTAAQGLGLENVPAIISRPR